jgi:hypothetical protein
LGPPLTVSTRPFGRQILPQFNQPLFKSKNFAKRRRGASRRQTIPSGKRFVKKRHRAICGMYWLNNIFHPAKYPTASLACRPDFAAARARTTISLCAFAKLH